MGRLQRIADRGAWLRQLVALPGTLDNLETWYGLLRRASPLLPTLPLLNQQVRDWIVEKAKFLVGLDLALEIIGYAGGAVFAFIVLVMSWNTYKARRSRWMDGYRAHVVTRDLGLVGDPPNMRSPWSEYVGRERVRSFYKVESYLDEFAQEHPEAVRGGKYCRSTFTAWLGRKLRGQEASDE